MHSPHRLIRLENATAAHDGLHVAFDIVTEDSPSFPLEVPITEVGAVIEYLVGIVSHMESTSTASQKMYSPIPVDGLGLATGRSAQETLLIVRLRGCDLAFSLDTTKVAELGVSFARTAQTLSATSNSPQ